MRYLGYDAGTLLETERAAGDNLALPLWAGIDAGTQEQVVSTIRQAARVGAGAA
jgi:dTDP-4-amino-4,6-dideoxygalactose transaminase